MLAMSWKVHEWRSEVDTRAVVEIASLASLFNRHSAMLWKRHSLFILCT